MLLEDCKINVSALKETASPYKYEKNRQQGSNFINNLQNRQLLNLYESVFFAPFTSTVWVCNFLEKEIGAKGVHKMLLNLSKGINFISIYEQIFL
jgi:hypothetical protein